MYIDIHSHTQHSTADTLVIRNQYPLTADPTEPFSVGIHPWYIDNWQQQWEALLPLATHFNCWAIGECGLDKNITTPLNLQQDIFLKHISLAEKLQIPLIIHCVKAYAEVIALRKHSKAKQLWILHGFRKNEKVAKDLLSHGIIPSFGLPLRYDTHLQELFKNLNGKVGESYFFETDDQDVSVKELYQYRSKALSTTTNL